MERNSKTPLRRLIGAIITFVIALYAFEVMIQPALVSISPVFADSPGSVNRTPDTPAQVALFATVLLGLFAYLMFEVLIYEGIDEFSNVMIGLYGLIVVLPIALLKKDVLSVFGIDRWVHDPTEENHQKDNIKTDE